MTQNKKMSDDRMGSQSSSTRRDFESTKEPSKMMGSKESKSSEEKKTTKSSNK